MTAYVVHGPLMMSLVLDMHTTTLRQQIMVQRNHRILAQLEF